MAYLVTLDADMPFLLKDSGTRVACTNSIRDEAQSYYSDLFAQPDPRFLEEDVQLKERIDSNQTEKTRGAKATFTMEDVRKARLSRKAG